MVGDKIKELREEIGMLQKELAEKLNVSASTIGMYELNKRVPYNDTLLMLSEIFNVSTDYLLGKSDAKNISSTTTDPLDKAMVGMSEENVNKIKSLSEEGKQEIRNFMEYVLEKENKNNKK